MPVKKKAGSVKKSAEEEYRKYTCLECGARLTSQETRLFLEGLYCIDPNGDSRQLCLSCKSYFSRENTI